MSILKVAQLGHPVLREKAEPVAPDKIGSPEIQALIDDMIDTRDEYSGAGLAAPQVHVPLGIIVIGTGANLRYPRNGDMPIEVMINPKITEFSEQMEEDWEGCLSLTELWGMVKRSVAVTVTGFDREGENVEIKVEGFAARVFQHEIDHLHGKVFVDRMSDMKSLSFASEYYRYGRRRENEENEG